MENSVQLLHVDEDAGRVHGKNVGRRMERSDGPHPEALPLCILDHLRGETESGVGIPG
jgi:hypothetical protein